MKRFFLLLIMSFSVAVFYAQTRQTEIKGIVTDNATGEPLIGVRVSIKNHTTEAAFTGLDGTFQLKTNEKSPVVCCSYIGFLPQEIAYRGSYLEIKLKEDSKEMSEVVVISNYNGSTDAKAIEIERQSANVVNVLGSRAMELAPDVTVGNIIQKMSGVTVERNSSGEGQYAILRGMEIGRAHV